jgi:hypothetical protein
MTLSRHLVITLIAVALAGGLVREADGASVTALPRGDAGTGPVAATVT